MFGVLRGTGALLAVFGSTKKEPVAPVEEPLDEEKPNLRAQEYRPGQVFSVNHQELLELQPERKAISNKQQLQQLYSPQEPKQTYQDIYYLEPEVSRQQYSLQPSHTVIARPHYSSDGAVASVGAALSVSDTGASQTSDSFEQELLGLFQTPSRQDERSANYRQDEHSSSYTSQLSVRPEAASQTYSNQIQRQEERNPTYPTPSQPAIQPLQSSFGSQNIGSTYQQVDRYVTKPTKKPTKLRPKLQINPPQTPAAPQQYLIETTNVQQQSNPQIQGVQQFRAAQQPQRTVQLLRYVPLAQNQQVYETPDVQGIKVVPAPKLQQQRSQQQYRFVPQYQQQLEATPKQYRIVEIPRPQSFRQEPRLSASSVERPVTYLKHYPELEKQRSFKLYDQAAPQTVQQPVQFIDPYYLRNVYKTGEQRAVYEFTPAQRPAEQSRVEPTMPAHSAIYVSKNLAPKKVPRPQSSKTEGQESFNVGNVNIEQYGQNIDDRRAHLPPPKNNKAYTPEEFAALVAAGYSVTPIPVGSEVAAQSRAAPEVASLHQQRRILQSRRNQYLPLRAGCEGCDNNP